MPKEIAKKTAKTEKKKLTQAEFEKKVLDLAKSGLTSEKIGESLRKEGIHSKEHKRTLSQILKEKGRYINPDLKNVEEKLDKIRAHFEKNKQDKRSMRDRERTAAKLRKLKSYFNS